MKWTKPNTRIIEQDFLHSQRRHLPLSYQQNINVYQWQPKLNYQEPFKLYRKHYSKIDQTPQDKVNLFVYIPVPQPKFIRDKYYFNSVQMFKIQIINLENFYIPIKQVSSQQIGEKYIESTKFSTPREPERHFVKDTLNVKDINNNFKKYSFSLKQKLNTDQSSAQVTRITTGKSQFESLPGLLVLPKIQYVQSSV